MKLFNQNLWIPSIADNLQLGILHFESQRQPLIQQCFVEYFFDIFCYLFR